VGLGGYVCGVGWGRVGWVVLMAPRMDDTVFIISIMANCQKNKGCVMEADCRTVVMVYRRGWREIIYSNSTTLLYITICLCRKHFEPYRP
jgi:hypothetical protein